MPTAKKRGRPSKAESEQKKENAQRAAAVQRRRQRDALICFVLGLFFSALAFIQGDRDAWQWLQNVMFGVFGVLAYIFGPLLIYLAVRFAVGKRPPLPQVLKAAFLLVTVAGTVMLFANQNLGIFENNVAASFKLFGGDIAVLFAEGVTRYGAGAVSALLGWPLQALCGSAAAKAVIIILLVAAVMLVTGKTVLDLVTASKKYFAKLKEAREKYQFNQELKQDTAELSEQETKQIKMVSAVDLPVRLGTSASIDIPLDDIKKTDSRIDVPLGPESPPLPFDIDAGNPKKRTGGPAADVVGEVFDRSKQMDDLFVDFGRKPPEDQGATLTPSAPYEYKFPPLSLLEKSVAATAGHSASELRVNANMLVETLESFGVKTRVVDIARGPTVTRYELQPEAGVRLSRIVNLADDLALNLAALGVRIEAPIPGKAAVGIEVPNKEPLTVRLRQVLESADFRGADAPLTIAMGVDLTGHNRVWDIGKMPHLLIAGSTGMGKSVFINAVIMSLIYKSSPDDLKLILIDPKMVEFTVYKGLPHLPVPVVTEPGKAAGALGAALTEMLRRYRLFADIGVRNIEEYNAAALKQKKEDVSGQDDQAEALEKKPRWLVVIDELADLMMTAPREVENAICRIAQMGRAAGIHLMVATQRPSVDVITGTIKNNIPTRVAFRVSSQIDSRTILDSSGAEKLVGRGDLLFLPVGEPKPIRMQGCYVSDKEIAQVTAFIKKNTAEQNYDDALIREIEENTVQDKATEESDGTDAMLEDAIEVVVEAGQASTSLLQRRLKLGYARAARIMDDMESRGIIGQQDGSKPRAVNITRQQWLERKMSRPEKSE